MHIETPARGRAAFNGVRILVALAMLVALVCSAPADAAGVKISNVQITNSADSVQIVVKASGPIAISVDRMARYLAFDVKGFLAASQIRQVKINSGDIGVIKCGWYQPDPPTARIAVEVSSKRTYTTSYSDDKRQATIVVAKRGSDSKLTAKPAAPAPKAEMPAEPAVAVKAAVETISTDKPVRVAAETPKPVLVASSTPVAVRPTAVQATPVVNAGNRVTLDFVGTDIHDVLKALALQSNTNVVASPDVKGEVTVALNNVTVDEALKLITNLSGFKFEQVDGTYVVGTAANMSSLAGGGVPTAPGVDRVAAVATIRHSDPAVLSKILAAQFKGVDVSTPPEADSKKASLPNGTTMLVISGTPDQVEAAKNLVAQVEDSIAASAAATQMELYEVKYADINELAATVLNFVPGLKVTVGPNQGFNLESPPALSLGNSTDVSVKEGQKAAAPPKMLLLQGSAVEIGRAKELLAQIDVKQPQILIEAKVVDVLNEGSKDLGVEWEWNSVKFDEFQTDSAGDPSTIMLGRFQRSPVAFLGTLNALVTSGKARVLANPNISALEGKPSSIFVGKELKYVVNIQQTPTGVNITTETARVGVQLHTISRVSSDGFITMDLHPEVSVPSGKGLEIPELGLILPEISRRYVDTTVRVKDGETIVIGGLINDEDRETMSGIPILSDLPFIGGLFKTKNKTKNHSEIMMFITPRILVDSK